MNSREENRRLLRPKIMMKGIALATVALLSLVAALTTSLRGTTENSTTSRAAVFLGTSPCADFAKPMLRIPAAEKCDRIMWQLSLFDSGKYQLTRGYGFHVDNRTFLPKGSLDFEGNWKLAKGRTSDPNAAVLHLDNGIAFASIDQNILHLLDTNKHLTAGDSGASYTLSRTQQSAVITTGNNGVSRDDDATASVNFTGRSPCQEIAKDLNRTVESGCFKLKWSIDLYRDPQTLAPTTYRLRGTLYRDEVRETEQIRRGNWKIIKGTKTNPNAIVYQLDAFGSDGPIHLLKADRDVLFFLAKDGSILVGDKDFSYTLNRGE